MKILHYALGFPPYRTGGLTKFCVDLMNEQVIQGNDVALLWPGQMKCFIHKIEIKKRKSVGKIESYELINPLPVSYDEGIKEIDEFILEGDEEFYINFLLSLKTDVIHFHTLMGLHKSFITAAKKLHIRTVFTTHDFFAICPKVTLFRDDNTCSDAKKCNSCAICNMTALSINKIKLLQSPIYRKMKDTYIVKKTRKIHRDNFLGKKSIVIEDVKNMLDSNDYIKLRNYYKSMIDDIDFIHYNSTISKSIYDNFFGNHDGKIISITHANIADHKRLKTFNPNKFRFTYLSAQSSAKGYYLLIQQLDKLWEKRKNFILNVYFTPVEGRPYLKIHSRYTYADLEKIFSDTDLLIQPSIWYETFGFTVIEALSYGVPVLISNHVGAKDLVNGKTGLVYNNDIKNDLSKLISKLTVDDLQNINVSICENFNVKVITELNEEIFKYCYLGVCHEH